MRRIPVCHVRDVGRRFESYTPPRSLRGLPKLCLREVRTRSTDRSSALALGPIQSASCSLTLLFAGSSHETAHPQAHRVEALRTKTVFTACADREDSQKSLSHQFFLCCSASSSEGSLAVASRLAFALGTRMPAGGSTSEARVGSTPGCTGGRSWPSAWSKA